MAVVKMRFVNIVGTKQYLNDAIDICTKSGVFHPENAASLLPDEKEFTPITTPNPYKDTLAKLVDVAVRSGVTLHYSDDTYLQMDNDEAYQYITKLDERLLAINEQKHKLKEDIAQYEQAAALVAHLKGMQVSLDEVFASKFVKVRIGRLPKDSYEKLQHYYDKNPYLLFAPYSEDSEYYWGIYLAPNEKAGRIDSIYSSLYFERIRVPDFVHGTPDNAVEEFEARTAQLKAQLESHRDEENRVWQEEKEHFLKVYSHIKYLHDSFEVRRYAVSYSESFYLVGFIPAEEEEQFASLFEHIDGVDCLIKSPGKSTRCPPPTKLKNNRFARPFEMFVTMYGLPSYHEFDPTNLVAITYTIIFGIMFGDVGQGIVLALCGWLAYKFLHMGIGRILVRCGLSSAVFGLVYGSVFGYEHLLDPLYKNILHLPGKPVEVLGPGTTNTLLLAAVFLGCVLIIISLLINVIGSLKKKDYGRGLFGENGLAGLVFYTFAAVATFCMMILGVNLLNPVFLVIFVAVPLVVIFCKGPLTNLTKHKKAMSESVGSYILENIFEMFEYVLSYATNTISFLRVGIFVISHAIMMSVVFTMAEMVGAGASIAVVIFGNVFVMAMEGLIVCIQVLRLEFYEMFSRFYDGDGKPYQPIRVDYDNVTKKQ